MRFATLLLCATLAPALEIDGTVLPPTTVLAGTSVPLRGADLLRWKWVVKIYVAACWLPTGAADPVIATPKRLAFTYRRAFTGADLAKATDATIFAGVDEPAKAALAPSLAAWNAAYPAVAPGDVLAIDHLPDGAVVMSLNGVERLRLTDPAFARALTAIWLGEHTFDTDLRQALTGG